MALVPVYRLYSSAQGDHFYTSNVKERDTAIAQYGYSDEGIAFYAYDSPDYEVSLWERCFVQIMGSLPSKGLLNSGDIVGLAARLADEMTREIEKRRGT
jgi:hypothetical protein